MGPRDLPSASSVQGCLTTGKIGAVARHGWEIELGRDKRLGGLRIRVMGVVLLLLVEGPVVSKW